MYITVHNCKYYSMHKINISCSLYMHNNGFCFKSKQKKTDNI